MYVLYFWLPLVVLAVWVFKAYKQDLSQIYHARGVSLIVAFFIPFYPFLSFFIFTKLQIDPFEKESGYISIFNSSVVYYVFSLIGLFVYLKNTSHKGLGRTGMIISAFIVLVFMLIIIALNDFQWR